MEDARKSFGDRSAPAAGRSFAFGAGEETLADIPALSLVERPDRDRMKREADAQLIAARTLCAQIAPALGIETSAAFKEISFVPDNLLTLLHSPEGWGALVDYVAQSLGKPPPNYKATVH